MKKIFIWLTLVLVLTGCSVQKKTEEMPDEAVMVHSDDDFGEVYASSEVPFNIKYSDKNIKCLSGEVFQEECEHGYYLYAVVSLDVGELSEKDLYWLDEEDGLRVGVRLDNKKNKLEFETFYDLCVLQKGSIRYYAFDTTDKYQYSFEDSELTIFIDVDNEKMYDSYLHSVEVGDAKDISEIDRDLYNTISEVYLNQINNLESLMED